MGIRSSIAIIGLFLLIFTAAEQCIAASCTIASNGTLAFGAIIPDAAAGPVAAATNPQLVINCKGNATITVTHNAGVNGDYTMSDGAANRLPYTFSVTPGPGTYSPPNNTNFPFTGSGTVSNYANAWTNNSVAGTAYTDTITFTIVY